MKKFKLSPIAADGWKFVIGFGLLGALILAFPWFNLLLGAFCLFVAVFSIAFFRDPEREIPATEDLLSPADGTVTEIATIEGEGYGKGKVVRIFLSVFDGHIQRSPVAGQVTAVTYTPGLFLDARDPKACFANEANAVEIRTPRGRILVKQIAGLIARRIVCWARVGDELQAGERLGLIRYGSQVDLYMPLDVDVLVKEGDKVLAGLTPMGRWRPVSLKDRASDADQARPSAAAEVR
jgi:phosphatidylserine decarboxylase